MPLVAAACAHGRDPYAATDSTLGLDRVVLYRNGVGYFERSGEVDGEVLTIKVRKDQVNDLLKSLTVVDRRNGQAVSVSMPLDPQAWANAALATLAPGQGSLDQVIDALRGNDVVLGTTQGKIRGRIVMIEAIIDEPDASPPAHSERVMPPQAGSKDFRLTVLDGKRMRIVRLSKVRTITLRDGDLALQFHRSLDATAGEGMFQQVAVDIRLAGANKHDLSVSYVVEAPMWKPTYRVVLPEAGKGKALLQGWAVVDNTSGEDWAKVTMSLTSGAPIAFRYDLHTPRIVPRSDLSGSGSYKRAAVALGETSYGPAGADRDSDGIADSSDSCPDTPETYNGMTDTDGCPDQMPLNVDAPAASRSFESEIAAADDYKEEDAASGGMREKAKKKDARRPSPATRASAKSSAGPSPDAWGGPMGGAASASPGAPPPPPAVDFESLRRSTQANARAKEISGLTRFDLGNRVTVPDGTSTMVAIINEDVEAEQTFLFKPGGAGTGYEQNPYRVVRFKNSTPFVLEPGPISIYTGGSFVGEGISEAVGTGTSTTIPFAVEPGVLVSSSSQYSGEDMHIVRIVRGTIEVENFQRMTTTWTVKGPPSGTGFTVLVRQNKQGGSYALKTKIDGAEELPDAYLIPVKAPPNQTGGSVEVVEQTPSRTTLTIWDSRVPLLLDMVLKLSNLDAATRARIQPLIALRQEIGRIDTELEGLEAQRIELDQRASETRENLEAIKKDPRANDLRARLSKRLEEFTRDGDKIGRTLVELQSKRLEKKIELEDLLQNLDLSVPDPPTPTSPPTKGRDGK
ncbi:DUF4139 domain-containing protein [Nannocystis sp.]|uniref:DUF4139 domain-containing protein n=1 Tax=Nannocystis sp. TaxID=1962667 RepID=UPI0025E2D5A5|nr:DUF4139 domain-containing protein [Nannocystis sp.]MBK7828181.1 DUF4139 domain-containing protein [Nannocystis sp.]